ncbi:hypothetical protein EMN47_01925 [Prolixibacteraceae bacterium JC049]|nr:hypothetical protein [Prolixibacteraceae bacterium JC049]
MKKLGWGILATLLSLTILMGCNDDNDGYSLGNFWVAIATVDKHGDSDIDYTLQLDDENTVLQPVAFGYPHFKTKNNQRVVVNYTILGDKHTADKKKYLVKVNALKEILTKSILELTEANKDSIGHDPLRVKDMWITNNYLNFKFDYYGGGKIHFINLVKDPNNATDDNGTILLELRHNENDDYRNNLLTGLVSFDLNSLNLTNNQEVKIKVKAKEYDNHWYEKTFSYTHSVE